MEDLTDNTVADLFTLMGQPAGMRRGFTALVKPPSPAAGAGYAYPIGASYWERIVGVAVTLTTAAVLGMRGVSLQLLDGDGYPFAMVPLLRGIPGNATVTAWGSRELAPAGGQGAALSGEGSVTDPGAFATIAQVTALPAGTYQVAATCYVSGTVTAADANNMVITSGTTGTAVIAYPGVANSPVTYNTQMITAAGGSIILQAVAAASGAAAVYSGSLAVTPLAPGGHLAKLPDLILKSGWSAAITGSQLNAADQLSAIGILTERYASNWADGALVADEESTARRFLRWARDNQQGM